MPITRESAFNRFEMAYLYHMAGRSDCLWFGFWPKGYDITVAHDFTVHQHDGDLTGATWTKVNGVWTLDFNGTSGEVDVGDIDLDAKSMIAWIYPDDETARSIVDFDGGTISCELDAGGDLTATGWTAPTIYVNDSTVSPAVAKTTWQCIAVTSGTAFTVSDLVIAHEASFFDGKMQFFGVFSSTLSASDIAGFRYNTRKIFGV